ncbi:MAG: hypothetical protein U0V73_03205 [Acidimicrobiia bacterium]
MPRSPIDDATVEAILAGSAPRDEFAGLMALVDDVRRTASGPLPVPSPALVAAFAVTDPTGESPSWA